MSAALTITGQAARNQRRVFKAQTPLHSNSASIALGVLITDIHSATPARVGRLIANAEKPRIAAQAVNTSP
jgi:hypothetical protein